MQSAPAIPRWLATNGASRSWLLLVAILPSLFFLGHWPALQLDIPATNAYLAVPFFGHDGVSVDDAPELPETGHERHCHTDAASCSDVPFAGASAFALMHTAVALLGNQTASVPMFALTLGTPHGATLTPDLRPPNSAI